MAEAAGLYYEQHGPPEAPSLVLSSGLSGSADYWAPNLAALAEHFRVLVYDHRGTGRSDRAVPPVVTVEQLADDIILLMDALGIARSHLAGHAAGGVAGLALALAAPERLDRLVVVNGWLSPDPHFLRCFEVRLNLLRHSGREAFLRAQPVFLYTADWISANAAALDSELPHQAASLPATETMEKRIAALSAFDIADRAADLRVPILALTAEGDMLVPPSASAFADRVPGARGARMAGGHACNITDPATFDAIVLDFLRS